MGWTMVFNDDVVHNNTSDVARNINTDIDPTNDE